LYPDCGATAPSPVETALILCITQRPRIRKDHLLSFIRACHVNGHRKNVIEDAFYYPMRIYTALKNCRMMYSIHNQNSLFSQLRTQQISPLITHTYINRSTCSQNGITEIDQNVQYKRSTGAYPSRDFHKICRVCTPFQDTLAVKISLDLLKELWSYGVLS